ncbi:co-chaperone YbbN [Ponticoccus sp. SC2-23]|uniref:thioredoxin family protein n=1 Tax=Alexandriicola marinus TaxID=2081710 RepID=UPI000FD8718B|nr:co-chaperone YbbN [Alexandriicola marinus]MBM1220568.1 co-chaperone YbbN [Ponticoccus sp. SC6-9]MBM1225254.1 co-chaperone YbbN [Ponticoccus sp. SC6-15]MBM1228768.1 co-chaperone YbbN [Ponticoccus sp. SC6-38]MBM1233595.1 co-chaperone YbbN [Ponticoccus sp. SC6-45]MBM1239269.1 co-chaperone YbbN [Ponticoccus sp. SC6-49]MBM1243051.1 co-chaperone YbbN [Ponticoccus sp. SC2-64]MBM1247119.1 co-chaperone YbbN [Ponticoccus sp. SC6-42]MBM1252222.1 co-chaperone YbbN [Ponticoccus sp. SC6-33]MBM1257278
MLEFSDSPKAPEGAPIVDGTDATFVADVVEASQTVPVIVDFWATWCGPCKTLGPALEAAVAKQKGKVRLVKIDVDQNQAYAGQLRVQSIPTVYAFWQGQPVDGFQGALPPSQVDEFVAKIAKLGGEGEDEGFAEAVEAAESMLSEGDVAGAAETFAAILQEEPDNAAAYGGLVRSYIALNDLDQAEAILNGAPAEITETPELEAARAQLELARQAASAGPVADLMAKVEADPEDHGARFELATALHASGKTEEAVEELLTLFRKDREWNEGAAKAQLFKIFDALPPNDPIVLNGRRKFSSLVFA